ncbi:MAG: translation initiation factor IF-2 [Opitutae bacterium]|nr:translation initiation factor IF-2 [Opitutae bacterium]MBT6462907.1 translation initiation factor IF-2 [Opitutae bacterium]MBT7855028.1 translation initiation factor IF-2 [Opitutae bacterium]
MAVRIHTLAKEIGMENKELMLLLQERGHNVKTVSSTIDNISAQALREELMKEPDVSESEPVVKESSSSDRDDANETRAAKPASSGSFLPAAAQVKSAEEVVEERRKKQEAEGKPAPVVPKERVIGPRQVAPPVKPNPPEPEAAPKSPPPVAGPAPTPPPAEEAKPAPAGAAPRPVAPDLPDDNEIVAEPRTAEDGSKIIELKPPIVVRDFAVQLGMKPFKLISELMKMDIFGSMNQVLEESVAQLIAEKHGFQLDIRHRGEKMDPAVAKKEKKEKEAKEVAESMEERPPVVCILGHVDHGKTTLLDTIRNAKVADGEAGGITQHVAAYQVEHKGKKISFIDTPGHAAFSKMRERGANVTDIAILVVAADDGFMPQTEEALKFAQKAQVDIIVAINKCDVKGANPDKVRTQMQEKGIQAEDWGGQTIAVNISALKGDGINEVLEMILLQAEVMELRASPMAKVEGVVLESQIEQGRGPTASIILQSGTLKVGAVLLCGGCYCKVRAIIDDRGENLKEAGPSSPVKVIGWSEAPEAGTTFHQVKNEKAARREVDEFIESLKKNAGSLLAGGEVASEATLESLFEAIESTQRKTLRVIVRADVRGSVEALCSSLSDISSEKVEMKIINADVGQISKSDVEVAQTAGAIILGFSTGMENGVRGQAKHHGVDIYQNNIIYEMIDLVTDAMAELLDPELSEKKIGGAEVRQVFPVGKSLTVAGCMVTEGRIHRDRKARLVRKGKVVIESRVETLKRFKDDVNEVKAGYECGMRLAGFNAYEEGDLIECIEIEKIRPSL